MVRHQNRCTQLLVQNQRAKRANRVIIGKNGRWIMQSPPDIARFRTLGGYTAWPEGLLRLIGIGCSLPGGLFYGYSLDFPYLPGTLNEPFRASGGLG